MGKTARWFRGLLGGKKDCPRSSPSPGGSDGKPPTKEKRRWSFVVRSSTKDRESTTTTTAAPATGIDQRRGSYREGWGSCSSASSCGGYNLAGDPNVVVDPNKHAIAVAAATAAVAEAAVAAAQAAAAVVKLTSSGRCSAAAPAYVSGNCALINNNSNGVEDWAAVKIQSAFRGYLARRALRALKGLVKLQALVRGHIMRKKTADTMRCMQALVRVQARARAGRFKTSDRRHLNKQLSQSHLPGPPTPEKYEYAIRSNSTRYDHTSSLKRNGSKQNSRDIYELDRVNSSWTYADHRIRNGPLDDEKGDKVLEIDPGKPQFDHRRGNLSQSSQHALMQDQISHSYTTMDSPSKDSTTAQLSTSSPSSGEVQSIRHPRRFPIEIDDDALSTAANSPHYYSASSSRRGPFTPTKSECSRSIYSGYSDHPNYMANTESSRAKVRSQSAPKQRLEFDKCSSMKRYSGFGFNETRLSAYKMTHKMTNSASTSTLHANFTRKAYPGSGRLDRLGMPIHSDFADFNGINQNRY